MTADVWLESATTTLGAILRSEHGMYVDRSLLVAMLDRRRTNLANSLGLPRWQVEPMLTGAEIRELATLMAGAHTRSAAVA